MAVKVELGDVQETLLIPLYGRALDAEARRSVLRDDKAAEIVGRLDYDFSRFRRPSTFGSVLRASIFDGYVRAFLRTHPEGAVVDLGCGLSTRFDRLDNGRVRWFDLDLPDSIALRHAFFEDSERYTMVAGSIFDSAWHEVVQESGRPVLLLSEAVLLYFPEAEVHALLRRLAKEFPATQISFDTAPTAMIEGQERGRILDGTRARMLWACPDPAELSADGLELVESRHFGQAQREVRRAWPLWLRPAVRLAALTPMGGYRVNLFRTG